MPKIKMLQAVNYEEYLSYSMIATIRITLFYAIQFILGFIFFVMFFIELYLQNKNLLSKFTPLKYKFFNTNFHSYVFLIGIFLFFIPICFFIYLLVV